MIQEALLSLAIATSPAEDPTKDAFVDSLVARGHKRAFVTEVIQDVQISSDIPRYFRRSTSSAPKRSFAQRYQSYKNKKGYYAYQRTLENFVEEYEQPLIQAEVEHGVDYRAIAATIVHETLAGAFTSTHGIIESFYTQFAKVPERTGRWSAIPQTSYLLQLAKELELTAEEVRSMRGSYAGAGSNAQFMPENLYRYYPLEHVSDLYDTKKSIQAVATYYAEHEETRTTPDLWREELSLGEEVTLTYHNDHEDEKTRKLIGFLSYNQSLAYAHMSLELTKSISRNEKKVAKARREYYFPTQQTTAQPDKLRVNQTALQQATQQPTRIQTAQVSLSQDPKLRHARPYRTRVARRRN